jgi:heptosyltransferase-2
LADICQKKRPDWKLLVVAGPEDVDVYMELLEMNRKKQLKNLIFSGFENSISQFISLIKLASLVVSSDTFGLHVALALNKWIVSLWGPQPKNETYSYGKEKKIDLGLDCAPCFAGTSNKCTNKQPLLCMEGIEANEVFQALEEVVFKM